MIRVLVVDDSALIRQVLTGLINEAPDMSVIGAVGDAYAARDAIRANPPDVVTLDIEMPRMDGLTFLEKLMKARPTPVLMISTLTEAGADATLRALELGAVDFIAKPKLDIRHQLSAYQAEIQAKIRVAAQVTSLRPPPSGISATRTRLNIGTEQILAIGASTGGTETIKSVLERLPVDCPGVVVTQHMPAGFTRSFAARLDRQTPLRVREAEGGERIRPGEVYIAPGNAHLTVVRSGSDYGTCVSDGDPVQGHRPSVDVLFLSVARQCGRNATGVILTGMGKDGADGLLAMKQNGALTLAQDEASCVVYGMPRVALERGGVTESVSLEHLPQRLVNHWSDLGVRHRV